MGPGWPVGGARGVKARQCVGCVFADGCCAVRCVRGLHALVMAGHARAMLIALLVVAECDYSMGSRSLRHDHT